ncbi:hypothetical protein LSUCC1028_03925 [Rhodobacterales bacterium LSUCC1028]|nr:hypothetical protein [Rhodobacterales bacterium LSUCC1028]
MTTAGFIYARVDSQRLPNKVFKKFGRRKLIDIIIERLRLCDLDKIYLVTSDRPVDDVLAEYCKNQGIGVFRGSFENLIHRSVSAINYLKVDRFLRVNGDSPFISPTLVNYSLQHFEKTKFVSNLFDRTFPYGVALELIDAAWYCDIARIEAPIRSEHLTRHLYQHTKHYETISITQNINMRDKRLTIDTPQDFKKLASILRDNHLVEYWDCIGYSEPIFNYGTPNA